MGKTILITGGAGFIGSHLADALLRRGHRVRVLDILTARVHGPQRKRPEYLHPDVHLIAGDIRNPLTVWQALRNVDIVFHMASKVGLGQSVGEVADFTEVNHLGTAVLLENLLAHPVERLIVTSSMCVYGEGLYVTTQGKLVPSCERKIEHLKDRLWEVRDENDEILMPLPTPESREPVHPSLFALSKYEQERMCLNMGNASGIPSVALRLFNVYGSRQSLWNPCAGVIPIFMSRLVRGESPIINEDGYQRRDYVHVRDVVQACLLAMESPEAAGGVFNIGSGTYYNLREIVRRCASVLGLRNISPKITGNYRSGDIRHCFADISLAREVLGYEPGVDLQTGLKETAAWFYDRAMPAYAAAVPATA